MCKALHKYILRAQISIARKMRNVVGVVKYIVNCSHFLAEVSRVGWHVFRYSIQVPLEVEVYRLYHI